MPAEQALEAALQGALAPETVPTKVPTAEPLPDPEPEAAEAVEEAPAQEAEAAEEPAEEVAEPSFEIEIDGAPEVVTGGDRIKELLAKGLKAGRAGEENARAREALTAQAHELQLTQVYQQALLGDLAELRALDQQLEQWERVDLSAMFETDPFKAMQYKEQRDNLRNSRNAKYQDVSQKREQLTRGTNEARANRLRAEMGALLAKVPEWRNAEKMTPEFQGITRELTRQYGFTAAELDSLIDHRLILVARDAMRYRELQRTKDDKVKQVRAAPPVVKPGTVQKQTNGKAEFVKVRQHIRQLGGKGNHKAQEALVTEMLGRVFK